MNIRWGRDDEKRLPRWNVCREYIVRILVKWTQEVILPLWDNRTTEQRTRKDRATQIMDAGRLRWAIIDHSSSNARSWMKLIRQEWVRFLVEDKKKDNGIDEVDDSARVSRSRLEIIWQLVIIFTWEGSSSVIPELLVAFNVNSQIWNLFLIDDMIIFDYWRGFMDSWG